MEGDNVEAVARVHMLVTLMSAMVGYLIKFLVLNVNDVLINAAKYRINLFIKSIIVPYVRGERGSLCIKQDVLKDAKTCEKAAEYFDMTYSGVESSDDAPKGCFYNDIQDAAVFNNHKTGRGEEAAGESTTSPLCKLGRNDVFLLVEIAK